MTDLKAMQKDIDEMSRSLEEPNTGGTEAPGTEAPGTRSPGTDAPITESPGTQAPGTTAPSTELPKEDPRDAEIRKLREEMEELKKGKPSTKAPSTKAPSTDPPISEEDFLGDTDLDDLTRDPEMFKRVLNKVYKKAREDTRSEIKSGIESVVRSIPDITKNTITVQAQLTKARDDFYKENKDLLPWSKSVATVMEELIAENPDKRYDELLPEVATEVRKRLDLQKQADKKGDKDNPPPLPRKKGGQRQTPNPDLSDLDKAMEEMDKALGLE